jgi:hypothetical protein
MEPDSSQGFVGSNPSPADSLRDFVAYFVRYLELRLELFGLESRETAVHLLVLALLFVSTVVCLGAADNGCSDRTQNPGAKRSGSSKAHPRYEETHPGIDPKSSMGMGQLRRHFGVASFSHTRAEKENLYS